MTGICDARAIWPPVSARVICHAMRHLYGSGSATVRLPLDSHACRRREGTRWRGIFSCASKRRFPATRALMPHGPINNKKLVMSYLRRSGPPNRRAQLIFGPCLSIRHAQAGKARPSAQDRAHRRRPREELPSRHPRPRRWALRPSVGCLHGGGRIVPHPGSLCFVHPESRVVLTAASGHGEQRHQRMRL